MPYSVRRDDRCPASQPWAVVKQGGQLMGCHSTRGEAEAQRVAILLSEREDDDE